MAPPTAARHSLGLSLSLESLCPRGHDWWLRGWTWSLSHSFLFSIFLYNSNSPWRPAFFASVLKGAGNFWKLNSHWKVATYAQVCWALPGPTQALGALWGHIQLGEQLPPLHYGGCATGHPQMCARGKTLGRTSMEQTDGTGKPSLKLSPF